MENNEKMEEKKVVSTQIDGEPLVDDVVEETPVASVETTEQPPVEATEQPPVEVPAEVQAEAPTEAPVEAKQPQGQAEKKKAKLTDFTAWILAEEQYTAEEAISIVRGKLQGLHYLDDGFLKATEGKDAFTQTKRYAPVYRCKATAQYAWKTGAKQAQTSHESAKEVSFVSSGVPAYLNACELGKCTGTKLPQPKADETIYPSKKQSFKDCMKAMRDKAETLSPHKNAKIEWADEEYEIVYVPVLTLTCTYQGVDYSAEVNLLNGACHLVQYLVAEKATKAAEQTMERVARAKRSIASSFFYALTFAVLSFLVWSVHFGGGQAQEMGAKGMQVMTAALILSATTIAILALRCVCNVYRKEKMVAASVNTGKLPQAKGAAFCSFLSFLTAVANAVVFAMFVLL